MSTSRARDAERDHSHYSPQSVPTSLRRWPKVEARERGANTVQAFAGRDVQGLAVCPAEFDVGGGFWSGDGRQDLSLRRNDIDAALCSRAGRRDDEAISRDGHTIDPSVVAEVENYPRMGN